MFQRNCKLFYNMRQLIEDIQQKMMTEASRMKGKTYYKHGYVSKIFGLMLFPHTRKQCCLDLCL